MIMTKGLWITIFVTIAVGIIGLYTAAAWYHGYHTADASWQKKDAERKMADATATAKLSEEYRLKEQKLNERIGEIETKYINQAGADERNYRDTITRLRAGNGLRVKSELTCRAVPNASAASTSGTQEVLGGLSTEVAERVIGIGHECDQVVLSLQACQGYVDSIRAP